MQSHVHVTLGAMTLASFDNAYSGLKVAALAISIAVSLWEHFRNQRFNRPIGERKKRKKPAALIVPPVQ